MPNITAPCATMVYDQLRMPYLVVTTLVIKGKIPVCACQSAADAVGETQARTAPQAPRGISKEILCQQKCAQTFRMHT